MEHGLGGRGMEGKVSSAPSASRTTSHTKRRRDAHMPPPCHAIAVTRPRRSRPQRARCRVPALHFVEAGPCIGGLLHPPRLLFHLLCGRRLPNRGSVSGRCCGQRAIKRAFNPSSRSAGLVEVAIDGRRDEADHIQGGRSTCAPTAALASRAAARSRLLTSAWFC